MNEWEQRARDLKAFKIARALRRVSVPPENWRDADNVLRERVAVVAQVRPPSDRTWQQAVDMLLVMIDEDDLPSDNDV